MVMVPLGLHMEWGVLDFAVFDPVGNVRLVGWSKAGSADSVLPPIHLNDEPLEPLAVYRFARPDVEAGAGQALRQGGLTVELRRSRTPADTALRAPATLRVGDSSFPVSDDWLPVQAHYAHLLDTDKILGRDDIYGEGPPTPAANPEVVALTAGLSGRVLDFGCGSGALLLAMREAGVDAYGIEIDRPQIHSGLHASARPYVTLYDGTLPSPFADGEFDAVVSSEVLEHIPNPTRALAEMARLSRGTLILTVPDISSIPRGFPHGIVPWHLLEATHINFFTQQSLAKALAVHFDQVEFGRIGSFPVNGSLLHTSVVAVCSRSPGYTNGS